MDLEHLALYPFVSEASAEVESLNLSLERLLSSPAYRTARARGVERVSQALEGEIEKPSIVGDTQALSELLSYPFARMLVIAVDDQLFTKRYALAEAKAAHTLLKTESMEFLLEFGEEFGLSAEPQDFHFKLHFTDYIRFSSPLKEAAWKLTNRQLQAGRVWVKKEEFARLLLEAIRERVEKSLSGEGTPSSSDLPAEVLEFCAPYAVELKEKFEVRKKQFGITDFGDVEPELFPPCISHALASVRAGINLAHSMRFAMTSFLLTIGMSTDDVLALFNVSPDFDAEKTLYQIEHIAGSSGTPYKPPACETMRTYGNCIGKNGLCERINHPLSYYQKKLYFKNKDKEEREAAKNEVGEKGETEKEALGKKNMGKKGEAGRVEGTEGTE
ncbi:MAG: DNA primase regulatory subunit PriL [Methanosarcinaceae archaeon]|nr:DNA primase regulatory subunit PriL [Methanosarcinaceae archaeon]